MPHNKTQSSADWLELVREKVQSLRFGVIQIVVHDSRVTQIERREKTRIETREISRFCVRPPDKLEETISQ